MKILDLVFLDNLHPKKLSDATRCVYYCQCPGCKSQNSFVIWNSLNWYYCRQCRKRGDSIQYLKDFHDLSYKQACERLGVTCGAPCTHLWKPTKYV